MGEVSPEQIEKFRALWREKFGVEITPKEALEKVLPLLTLMKAVYRPMTEAERQEVQQRQQAAERP
jgi:hypothetical protein